MPRNKKQKPEAPVVEMTDVPLVNVENIPAPAADVVGEVVEEQPAPIVEVVEEAVVAQPAPVVLPEPAPEVPDTLELVVKQTREDKEGNTSDVHYAVRFELPKDKSSKLTYIVGTAIDTLTKKMRLWKDCKVKPLFDSRKPLEIMIKSSQYVLDLGKADQVLKTSLKVNNGIRSQLAFVNRMIAITNDMCTEIVPISVEQLIANKGQDYQLTYGKAVPKGISDSTIKELSRKEFVVTEKGELAEA